MTTAPTAATSAPTVKASLADLTKAIASGDYTDAQMDEFVALSKEAKNAKSARQEKLTQIADLIKAIGTDGKNAITTSEAIALFPAGFVFKLKPAKGTGKKPAKPATPKVLPSDSNADFIVIPRSATDKKTITDVVIKQGRSKDNAGKDKMFIVVPALLKKHGKSVADLSKFIVDTKYGETAEGKAEVKAIVDFVSKFIAAEAVPASTPAAQTPPAASETSAPAATPAKKTGKV